MEREKFEESYKRAFDDAEVSPSAQVWTNIELDLEKARGGELKRRLLFYQMLAAASVVFAMAIGGVGYYHGFNTNPSAQNTIAQTNTDQGNETSSGALQREDRGANEESRQADASEAGPAVASVQPDARSSSDNRAGATVDGASTTRRSANSRTAVEQTAQPRYADNHYTYAQANEVNVAGAADDRDGLPTSIDARDLPPLYAARQVRLDFKDEQPEVDPVVAMLAKLERRELEVQQKEDREKTDKLKGEDLWTSIGFSAGSFNTVQAPSASGSAGSPTVMTALAAPIVDQESKATGYSYSMGINLGTRIAERWVLQGGVNYLTHSSEYTSNNVVMEAPGFMSAEQRYKPATTNAVVKADEFDLGSKIVYSAPYSVNNSMRYLSIPMQAGYLLVDETFGLQINAGVATDLFLQNTVDGEGDQLARTTAPGGADSPYRTVNLSGLVGTEVSYRFGPHYRISLNPGIRYPFNTIYKSELGVESSPLTFDVGLRFRYIFR